MKIESAADKRDILKCLKINLTRTNRSMVVVRAKELPKSCVVYVLEGFIKKEDHERIKDDLNYFEIPYKERCIASIRMVFGSPFTLEFNWELDFKKVQSCMIVVSDAMKLIEYLPRVEPLADDEYSKAKMVVSFGELKQMELFVPYADIPQDKKEDAKPKAKPKTESKSIVVKNGRIPISHYRYKNKNANKKKAKSA